MQHSGAVELYRSGTDAQALGNRLVRFAPGLGWVSRVALTGVKDSAALAS